MRGVGAWGAGGGTAGGQAVFAVGKAVFAGGAAFTADDVRDGGGAVGGNGEALGCVAGKASGPERNAK